MRYAGLLLACTLLIFGFPCHSQPAIFNQPQLSLTPYFNALEDPVHKLSVRQILVHQHGIKLTTEPPSFGYSQSTIWLTAKIISPQSQAAFLEIANPRLDHISFFLYQAGKLINKINTGDQQPFSSRPVAHHHFVFPLKLQANKSYRLILKINSSDNLFLPIKLWTPWAFYQNQTVNALIYGCFYGTLAMMILLNLFIGLMIHDRKHLILSVFILTFSLALFSLNGLSNRFLWGDWVWWSKHSLIFLEAVSIILGLIFTRLFLNTQHYSPRFDRYLLFLMQIAVVTCLLSLTISYRWNVLIMSILSIIVPLITIGAAYICWQRHYPPARYFLIAWSFFLAGTVAYGLMLQQILPSNLYTQYGMHLGLVWLAVLLLLSLTDRYNHLKQQKEQAQLTTIQHQKKVMLSISRFVPIQFLNLLEKKHITDIQYGDAILKKMFIMFTDIRGYTHLSETMTAEESLNFLNTYMRFMEPVIEQHHGFIDKFIGDAIMALFPGTADQALSAAIAMQQKMQLFNAQLTGHQAPQIKIGIGIHGGEVMLGTVGSNARLDTTVIGDAVNLASRLECLTKEHQTTIIISDAMFHALQAPDLYKIYPLGKVPIRGKRQPVKVYRVSLPNTH